MARAPIPAFLATLYLATQCLAVLFLAAAPAQADRAADITRLEEALRMREVFAIMREEGLAYGSELEAELFPDRGGDRWKRAVQAIYDPERVYPAFHDVLVAELADQSIDLAPMLSFFTSDLGRRAIALEVSARRALLDQAVEDASRLRLDEMRAEADPRLETIGEFVAANDLVDANVTSSMNAYFAFYRSLASAGAFGADVTEGEILEDVWRQEPQMRGETEIWINSFLAMAYAPLSDAELRSYIDFSRTEAGQTLNRALFAGFDVIFVDVSDRLGTAAAGILGDKDL